VKAMGSGVSPKELALIRKTLKANRGCSIEMNRGPDGERGVRLTSSQAHTTTRQGRPAMTPARKERHAEPEDHHPLRHISEGDTAADQDATDRDGAHTEALTRGYGGRFIGESPPRNRALTGIPPRTSVGVSPLLGVD
jgi:hypothetical protein